MYANVTTEAARLLAAELLAAATKVEASESNGAYHYTRTPVVTATDHNNDATRINNLIDAATASLAELNALRTAMFATYAAASNGATPERLLQLIEAERDAYEAQHTADTLRTALAKAPKKVSTGNRIEDVRIAVRKNID